MHNTAATVSLSAILVEVLYRYYGQNFHYIFLLEASQQTERNFSRVFSREENFDCQNFFNL